MLRPLQVVSTAQMEHRLRRIRVIEKNADDLCSLWSLQSLQTEKIFFSQFGPKVVGHKDEKCKNTHKTKL